jgi:tetratricopeptide (TPR) repeat protein
MRFAKFSFIFAHNGRWKDAEELQLAVKAYTDRVLGPDHRSSRRITLALAQTYWNQGRGDEAAELQDTVLQACIKWLGPDDYETLMAEELLGETRWQQGRYSDARVLQQHAVNGLTKLKGSGDEDTLTAMGRLGRTEAKFYENLDEAKKHITEAFRGLSNLLGPKHTKTLSVQEDLALLALQMKEDLLDPLEWLQHVLACRHEKLGKEHPYTLLAMTSLARVKTALGAHDEAEDLVRRGLSITERNLGKGHIGYLMGKTLLGTILTNQSKYAEAESTLLEVMEKQRHLSACRGDFHPDRLGAMIELVSCHRLQGKLDESIQYCDEVIKGLQRISATQHPPNER